ncbi:hypothetical protein MKW92_033094 [Papaver armeniacum]|nr:hypothetical protein MKW92_033094 [Papaver armeniacum]
MQLHNNDELRKGKVIAMKLMLKRKTPITLDHLSVRGNNIRYDILLENLNLETLLVEETPRVKPKEATIEQNTHVNFCLTLSPSSARSRGCLDFSSVRMQS